MKPAFTHFVLEESDGIAVFTMNRPEVMNALNETAIDDLALFADYFEKSSHLKVAIITGAGKAFIAGADVGMLTGLSALKNLHFSTQETLLKLENCSKPIIAAVNGYAFGGGLEIAMACDLFFISENAIIGMPETGLGFMPAAGGSQRLARKAGMSVAKDMILTGRNVTAQEAYQYGIASRIFPKESLMEETMKAAKGLAKRAPLSLSLAKRAVNAAFDVNMSWGIELEKWGASLLCTTEDMKEGTTAFVEKRSATFTGK